MRRLVLAVMLLVPAIAHPAWVVDERGQCVQAWTPASLARGPTAIANAPLLPFRTAVGGAQVASEDRSPGLRPKILLPPLLAVGGAGMGVLDAVVWVATGLADTVTGGSFALAPEEATHFGVGPVRPPFITEPARTTDPCGRPLR